MRKHEIERSSWAGSVKIFKVYRQGEAAHIHIDSRTVHPLFLCRVARRENPLRKSSLGISCRFVSNPVPLFDPISCNMPLN